MKNKSKNILQLIFISIVLSCTNNGFSNSKKTSGIKPLKKITLSLNNFMKYDFQSSTSNDFENSFFTKLKAEASLYNTSFLLNQNNYAWGISLSLKDFKIPFSTKIGNISIFDGISKLKNPKLSSSPYTFAAKTSSISPMKASLPSGISQNQKTAYFFNLFAKPKIFSNRAFFSSSVFFNENENFAANFYASLVPGKNKKLCVSSSFLFTDINNNDEKWYSPIPYFSEAKNLFQSYQLSWSSMPFTLKSAINLFPNPIDLNNFFTTWNFESSIKTASKAASFLLNFGYFGCNSKEIWTAQNTNLKTFHQIKINPQTTFFAFNNKIKIRTGYYFIAEETLSKDFIINEKSTDFLAENQTSYLTSQQNNYLNNIKKQIFPASLNYSTPYAPIQEENSLILPLTSFSFCKKTMNYEQTVKSKGKLFFDDMETVVFAKIQTGTEIQTKKLFFQGFLQVTGIALGNSFENIFLDSNFFKNKDLIFKNGQYTAKIKFGIKNKAKPNYSASFLFAPRFESNKVKTMPLKEEFYGTFSQYFSFYPLKNNTLYSKTSVDLSIKQGEISKINFSTSLKYAKTFSLFRIETFFSFDFLFFP